MGGIYMKKKFLIPLVLSFLLTGCLAGNVEEDQNANTNETQQTNTNNGDGDNSTDTNTNDELNNPANDNNSTETNDDNGDEGSNNAGNDDNGQTTTPESGGENDSQIPDNALTTTVTFLNNAQTNSTLHNNEKSREEFVTWFNQSADNMLESISVGGFIQIQYIGNEKDSWRFSTLTLGSASNNGSLTFNFKCNVYKVKFNIQGYCKYIEYSDSYNVDTSSVFHIDSDEYDLSVSPAYTGLLEKRDVEKTYSTPTKFLTISATGGRVFVHSMEITYTK